MVGRQQDAGLVELLFDMEFRSIGVGSRPFAIERELELLASYQVVVLVSKNQQYALSKRLESQTNLVDKPLHDTTLVLLFPDILEFLIAAVTVGLPFSGAAGSVVFGCLGGYDGRA